MTSIHQPISRRHALAGIIAAGLPTVLPFDRVEGTAQGIAGASDADDRYRQLLADAARAGGGPLDDAWWARIARAFDLGKDFTVLGSVVRGVAPRPVLDFADKETRRRNAYRPRTAPDPDADTRRRTAVAKLIGSTPDETAIVRNTTEGVTTVLLNWPLSAGDEIVCSVAEHGPFHDTLAFRAARDGVTIRQVQLPIPAARQEDLVAAYDAVIGPRTRLVLLPHVMLYGQIMPVREIAALVHARGGHLLVDGVLSIGHIPVDVQAMGCDFFAAGFHKWGMGARGTAAFIVRRELIERLAPLFGAIDAPLEGRMRPLWDADTITKFESYGAHPESHHEALERSVTILEAIGVPRIRARLYALNHRWRRATTGLPGLRVAVTDDASHHAGLVGFRFEGKDLGACWDVAERARVILCGTEPYGGVFGIPADRPQSVFAVNAAVYTSPGDIDRFVEVLHEMARL